MEPKFLKVKRRHLCQKVEKLVNNSNFQVLVRVGAKMSKEKAATMETVLHCLLKNYEKVGYPQSWCLY